MSLPYISNLTLEERERIAYISGSPLAKLFGILEVELLAEASEKIAELEAKLEEKNNGQHELTLVLCAV